MKSPTPKKDFSVLLDSSITDVEASASSENNSLPMSDDLKNVLYDIKNNHQSLDDLASQIREGVSESVRHANNAVEGALITGALLIEAKKQLIHGEWESWLSKNCNVAVRTAQAYMRLAKSLPLDAPNTQRVALLPLRKALKAISTNQHTTVRQPDIPRIAGRTEREKSCSIFSNAINALKGVVSPNRQKFQIAEKSLAYSHSIPAKMVSKSIGLRLSRNA